MTIIMYTYIYTYAKLYRYIVITPITPRLFFPFFPFFTAVSSLAGVATAAAMRCWTSCRIIHWILKATGNGFTDCAASKVASYLWALHVGVDVDENVDVDVDVYACIMSVCVRVRVMPTINNSWDIADILHSNSKDKTSKRLSLSLSLAVGICMYLHAHLRADVTSGGETLTISRANCC